MIDLYGGGPVGLSTLSVNIGEETETVEDMYEPYLIQKGFIKRTPRGRIATPFAYAHFGYDYLEGHKIKGLNKREGPSTGYSMLKVLFFIFQSLCNGINILF